MGLVREPDYWSSDIILHYLPIASRISRWHFEEIWRYLHFVNNKKLPARGSPGFHWLQHVKLVIDSLWSRCSIVYQPGANISVDETMVPFKGT